MGGCLASQWSSMNGQTWANGVHTVSCEMQDAAIVFFLRYFKKWTLISSFLLAWVHETQTIAAPSQLCVFCHKVIVPGLWCFVLFSNCLRGILSCIVISSAVELPMCPMMARSRDCWALPWAALTQQRQLGPLEAMAVLHEWTNPKVLLSLLQPWQ